MKGIDMTDYEKIYNIAQEEYEWCSRNEGIQPYMTTDEFIQYYLDHKSKRLKE